MLLDLSIVFDEPFDLLVEIFDTRSSLLSVLHQRGQIMLETVGCQSTELLVELRE